MQLKQQAMFVPAQKDLESIERPKGAPSRWGYCGVAAISAATSVPPLRVLRLMPGWKGLTPSGLLERTVTQLGHACERILVPRRYQRLWPLFVPGFPSDIAMGRVYYGEGRHVHSHWVCFSWNGRIVPLLYDNLLCVDRWVDTAQLSFYPEPTRLKSLYFLLSSGAKVRGGG